MLETLFESTGIIRYQDGNAGLKLIIEIDSGISDFYRSLIPKYYNVNRQKYPPHISVIRKETPQNMELWGKYEGNSINFFYSNVIQRGTVYWWLNVFSKNIENLRLELGLSVDSIYTLPPDGFVKCFHTTLCNSKELVRK